MAIIPILQKGKLSSERLSLMIKLIHLLNGRVRTGTQVASPGPTFLTTEVMPAARVLFSFGCFWVPGASFRSRGIVRCRGTVYNSSLLSVFQGDVGKLL